MTLMTMHHHKRLALCATTAVALMMTACSSDELLEGDAVQNPDNAVTFGTYLTTRATDLTTAGLRTKGFGVYAYHLTSDLTQPTTEDGLVFGKNATQQANFMNDQYVSYDAENGVWTYSPIKYWPGNTDSKITFMAWAPYDKKQYVTLSSTATTQGTGDPTLSYTIKNPQTKKLDNNYMFDLTAARQYNLTAAKQHQQVTLSFAHVLSRLNINVKTDMAYSDTSDASKKTTIKINKVMLTGEQCYTGGTLNLASGLWSARTAAKNDSVDLSPIMREVIIGSDTDKHSLFNADKATSNLEYLYMVPNVNGQTTSGDITVSFYIEIITVDSNLPGGKTTQRETRTIKVPQQLVQGLAYNWNFTFSLSSVKFDASVEDWDYAEDQPGTDDSSSDNSGSTNNGNIDQYINEGFYLCNDKTYGWSFQSDTYKFTYAGDGLFTLKVAGTLEDFMISTKSYFLYGIERTTKEVAYTDGKLLNLGSTYNLITSNNSQNIHYVWLNDGLNYYTGFDHSDDDAEEFTDVTLTFDPINCTVTAKK